MEAIAVCALLLLTTVVLLVGLKQLAFAALFHVLIIYLGRFVLLHGGGDDRLQSFRIKVAVGILYLSLSAILFCLFGPVMPPWGAVAVWAMSLAAIELGYAFFFPYSCYHIDKHQMVIDPTVGAPV